jgi:hypothetical protein
MKETKMFRKLVTALALLLPATGALGQSVAPNWETGTQQRHRDFYQNVMEDDLIELLGGRVWMVTGRSNLVGVQVYLPGGELFQCFAGTNGLPKNDGYGKINWESVRIENPRQRITYPLIRTFDPNSAGYLALKYVPETGAIYGYSYWKRHWWEDKTGHLQEDLPAVTYTLCPGFPPAESLGLKVNRKQTSPFYSELVAQDPGRRVKRPDLVTEETWVRY